MHTNEESCNWLTYACQIWNPLCYAMQASVILEFNHIINRGLRNSLSALPFNHCQPGKSCAYKEEQNHWSGHYKNALRTGMAKTTAHGNTVLPLHKAPRSLTQPLVSFCRCKLRQNKVNDCNDQWWSLKSITHSIHIQYKGQPSSDSAHTVLTVLLRVWYCKIIS